MKVDRVANRNIYLRVVSFEAGLQVKPMTLDQYVQLAISLINAAGAVCAAYFLRPRRQGREEDRQVDDES